MRRWSHLGRDQAQKLQRLSGTHEMIRATTKNGSIINFDHIESVELPTGKTLVLFINPDPHKPYFLQIVDAYIDEAEKS
jgi:hypothetical protein